MEKSSLVYLVRFHGQNHDFVSLLIGTKYGSQAAFRHQLESLTLGHILVEVFSLYLRLAVFFCDHSQSTVD